MNSRVRPSQLQRGEVQLSKNGRMDIDGTWQPRKGVETLAGKITLDQNSTLLPFVITKANRENGVGHQYFQTNYLCCHRWGFRFDHIAH